MRVLIIQENGRHEANRNYRECFCLQRGFKSNGVDSDVWGKGHDNYETEPDWESYDLVFSIENWDWMPDLSKVQTKKCIWAIDAHCKGTDIYNQIADDNNFDRVLHATPTFAEDECWFPNCYDDTLIKPRNGETSGIGFCGNINNRGQLLQSIKSKFPDRFRLDEFVIGDAMVEAINSYDIHWNANISCDINYRNFETMGCNTLLLTSSHSHYGPLQLIHGVSCFIYRSQEEMLELIEYLLENKDLRDKVAREGYDIAKNCHTYNHRAKTLKELIK
jgi:glycosyltransferase involved in cell wall biosynthesis